VSTLAVVGPTASGKSRVAGVVARRRTDVEIVAIDAFTVYRGMDVATAKPDAEERARVPHHLVDVLEPTEELSVAGFQTMARAAIGDVRRRGRTPLLVGGSGLYWRAVVDDLRFPPTDPTVRDAIAARFGGDAAAAHARLAALDPEAAARIDPANLRRSVRALEVIELTGEPFSEYATAWDDYVSVYPDLAVAYLEPDTGTLRASITERARAMVDMGLVDEAAELRRRAGLSRTAAQAIGYAEAFAVLDGTLAPEDLAQAIATRTWRFAKRQRAWFRADPRCAPVGAEEAVARLVATS
jgi:tRNA dimethylallyltransferase